MSIDKNSDLFPIASHLRKEGSSKKRAFPEFNSPPSPPLEPPGRPALRRFCFAVPATMSRVESKTIRPSSKALNKSSASLSPPSVVFPSMKHFSVQYVLTHRASGGSWRDRQVWETAIIAHGEKIGGRWKP